jgi:hypothetical protein
VQILERFIDAGAAICVLRMGAEGSLLAARSPAGGGNESDSSADVHMIAVPAAPANVRDVTGCGNAFNGGLLAALQRGETLCDAAAWGSAVAASMAEATGAPACGPQCPRELQFARNTHCSMRVPVQPPSLRVHTVLLQDVCGQESQLYNAGVPQEPLADLRPIARERWQYARSRCQTMSAPAVRKCVPVSSAAQLHHLLGCTWKPMLAESANAH